MHRRRGAAGNSGFGRPRVCRCSTRAALQPGTRARLAAQQSRRYACRDNLRAALRRETGEETRRDPPNPPIKHCPSASPSSYAPSLRSSWCGSQRAGRRLKVPAGLPDWTFNIPDKVQPSAVRPEGIVRAPGSAKEYDWAQGRRERRIRRTGFPMNIPPRRKSVTGGPGITICVRLVPSDVRPGPSGSRRHRRHARRVPDPADGVLQGGHAQGRRAHGPDREGRHRTTTFARPPNISPP